MTDSSPGPGWWLASDGNWYPPHLHPDASTREAEVANARTGAGATGATRTVESDADILAAFHITDQPVAASTASAASSSAASSSTAPTSSTTAWPAADAPPDEVLTTTGGGIDWEAVARERAAQRELRARQAGASRRKIYALAGGAVALIIIFLIARPDRGGDGDRTLTTPDTTIAGTGASASGAVSTTAAPATTGAPTSSVSPTSSPTGASGASASGATASGATAASGGTGAGTNVSVFSLAPGSCIDQDNLTTGLVTTVKSVPCTQSHSHEVYLKTSVAPADQPYDAAKVTAFANQACTQGFEAYVGIAYEQSKYYFLHLAPSAESWNKNRDRDVVCLLLLEGQKLTTSVKGKKE